MYTISVFLTFCSSSKWNQICVHACVHACVHSFMHFEISATCKCSSTSDTSERFYGNVCYFVPGGMNSLTNDFPHIISEMFHMLHFETVDICKDVPQVAQVNGFKHFCLAMSGDVNLRMCVLSSILS